MMVAGAVVMIVAGFMTESTFLDDIGWCRSKVKEGWAGMLYRASTQRNIKKMSRLHI